MTNKKITFTFKKAIESMNQNVKGGFSYKAEWDSTPGNPNKTATSKVGSNPLSSHVLMVLAYLNQF